MKVKFGELGRTVGKIVLLEEDIEFSKDHLVY